MRASASSTHTVRARGEEAVNHAARFIDIENGLLEDLSRNEREASAIQRTTHGRSRGNTTDRIRRLLTYFWLEVGST